MKARQRALVSTLVLLALAGAAVALAFFGVARKDEARAAKKTAEERLYAFRPAEVKSFTLVAKGDTTRLERAGDGWRLTAPVEAEAEKASVNSLLEAVAGLKRKAAIAPKPDPASLARYGLATPRARLTLALDGGKSATLALGDENPFDGSSFVEITSGAVDLVGAELKWSLEKSAFDLRDKRLLPFAEDRLERLEVVTPRLSYALAPGAGGYRLLAPVKEAADDAALARVLAALRDLRATSFTHPSEGDAALGLDHPRFTVKLALKGGPTRTLDLGAPPPPPAKPAGEGGAKSEPPLYARFEGSTEVATVPAEAASGLDQDLFALRDKKVLHFDRDKLSKLGFTVGGKAFEGQRGEGHERLEAVVSALAGLEARAFPDEGALARYGLDHPEAEVLLSGADGQKLDRLVVAEKDGKAYARADSSPRVAEVDPAALKALPRSEADLAEAAKAPPTPTAGK